MSNSYAAQYVRKPLYEKQTAAIFITQRKLFPICPTINDLHLAKAKEAVGKHIAGIITKDFMPCPGQHCQSCDYGAICKYNGS